MRTFNSHQSFRRGTLGVAMMLFAALALSSCYPDYGLTVTDYDAVATYHAPGTDYGSYASFYLIDTVQHILPPSTPDDVPRTFDQTILTSVRNNLEAAGYVSVADPALADVLVQTSITRQEYMVYYGWGGYYGWYWPGYYPPVYGYSYSTGTVVVDMADVAASAAATQVKSVWFAVLQGLADVSTTSATETRIRNGINQAFIQSPYLGAH